MSVCLSVCLSVCQIIIYFYTSKLINVKPKYQCHNYNNRLHKYITSRTTNKRLDSTAKYKLHTSEEMIISESEEDQEMMTTESREDTLGHKAR